MNLSVLYPPEDRPSLSCGSRLKFGHSRYILAQVGWRKYTLINLESGNRWAEPILVDSEHFTRENVQKLIGKTRFDQWEIVEP